MSGLTLKQVLDWWLVCHLPRNVGRNRTRCFSCIRDFWKSTRFLTHHRSEWKIVLCQPPPPPPPIPPFQVYPSPTYQFTDIDEWILSATPISHSYVNSPVMSSNQITGSFQSSGWYWTATVAGIEPPPWLVLNRHRSPLFFLFMQLHRLPVCHHNSLTQWKTEQKYNNLSFLC